jgi:hypothetical protein
MAKDKRRLGDTWVMLPNMWQGHELNPMGQMASHSQHGELPVTKRYTVGRSAPHRGNRLPGEAAMTGTRKEDLIS